MNGCKGAWLHAYTDWFAKNGGISPHEGSYPYLDKYPNLNCRKARYVKKWNSGAKVLRSIQDWRCNEDKLKKMVYENGAVLVGLYASDDGFVDYDVRLCLTVPYYALLCHIMPYVVPVPSTMP